MNEEPDQSHVMTQWKQDVCCLSNNDRFGQSRYCKKCGGKDYMCGGAGSRWQSITLQNDCIGE
jgi:MoaA/NifB/PqqE/SkfB family radical SAM enzyme